MTGHETPETVAEARGAAVARIAVAAGGVLFLRPGRYVLGRGSDCDLVLADRGCPAATPPWRWARRGR